MIGTWGSIFLGRKGMLVVSHHSMLAWRLSWGCVEPPQSILVSPPACAGPQSGSLPPGSLPMVKGIGMVIGIMGKTRHRKAAHKQQSPSQHKYRRTPVYLFHASPDLHSQKMAALSHICAATMLPIP